MDALDQACINSIFLCWQVSFVVSKMKKWTESEVAQLKILVKNRVSKREIATRLGRSPNSVGKKLQALGLKIRMWTSKEKKVLQQLLDTGYSYEEIARILRRTSNAIRIKAERDLEYKRGLRLNPKPKFSLDSLSDADKGYIAGFLDGEGTFTITRHQDNRRKNSQFTPYISGSNSNRDVIEWLQSKLPSCNIYVTEDSRPKRKDCFHFRITTSADIIEIIKAIASHLKVKKRQAELLKEWCEENLKKGLNKPPTQRMLHIYNEMKRLNKRGK